MNKKKVAAIVIGALVVALALPTVAFAGSHGGFGGRFAQCQGEGLGAAVMRTQGVLSEVGGRAFVDADGDGVCDRYADGRCGGYVDADGDGVCDDCGFEAGACRGYVDENGDGICDNYADGAGCGRGYVDADGDGVCDRSGSGACGQGGNGSQRFGAGQGGGYGMGHGGKHHQRA